MNCGSQRRITTEYWRRVIMISISRCTSWSRLYGKPEEDSRYRYGRKEEWDSRKVAMAFYKRAMACSEGSEQSRYTRIYLQLATGKNECTDEEEYDEDSH